MPATLAARTGAEPFNPLAASLLDAFARADHRSFPYDHWLLEDVLPGTAATAIAALPFPAPGAMIFNGRRETNNAQRVYFTPENQARHPVCREAVEAFRSTAVRAAIMRLTGADLAGTRLRIEYCQDTDGFWLEPHTDILIKKFTMLVYLSDDPKLRHCGTDIYQGPPDFAHVGSAPYEMNKGLIFIPGADTWHGVARKPIPGLRKSIIINYVAPDWRDTWELAE